MKVHTITFLASSISGLSLIACLFAVCQIYVNLQNIWEELDMEIGAFRVTTDDLWNDMLVVGRKTQFRRRRQTYADIDKPKTGGGYEEGPKTSTESAPKTYEAGPHASAPGIPQNTNPPSVPPSLSTGPSENCGCKTGADNKCPAGPPLVVHTYNYLINLSYLLKNKPLVGL